MEGYKPQDFSFFHRSEKLVQQFIHSNAECFGNASSTFKSFKEEYQSTHEVSLDERFQGHPETINRRSVGIMATIKLDSNFNVVIFGGEQLIERGFEEKKNMNYYKLYLNEEK